MNEQPRLKRLQQLLTQTSCDALLIDHPIDLYYMTGLVLSAGLLFIHAEGSYLILDSRYTEVAQQQTVFPVLSAVGFTLKKLLTLPELRAIKKIGIDAETTSYKKFNEWSQELSSFDLIPLDSLVQQLRLIKDPEEIQQLKKSADLCCQGFDYVLSLLRPGISEWELALELEIFWKKQGALALSFDSIIAFGAHSSMPHYRASHTRLQKGMPVLIDIGVNLNHYHSDMTRTVFFGEPSQEMHTIYEVVKEAQLAALALCRPGIKIQDIDHEARHLITTRGYGAYFGHGLGHGVGLEIHEAPSVSQKNISKDLLLQSGMVITIEPGIYLPQIGGVRIEDTIVVTDKSYENLIKRSKELIIID